MSNSSAGGPEKKAWKASVHAAMDLIYAGARDDDHVLDELIADAGEKADKNNDARGYRDNKDTRGAE